MKVLLNFLLILLVGFEVGGCADLFRSPYQSFVASMDHLVEARYTIDDIKVRGEAGIAADRYFLSKERSANGYDFYHYKRLNIWSRYCYYHFIVDPVSQEVVGWGFDFEKADPKIECAASG